MAIEVRHGTGAGPVAAAAFGGAVGQARGRLAGQAAQSLAVAEQANLQRHFTAERDQFQQAAALQRGAQQFAFQQKAADAAQRRGRSDLEFGLTTRQRVKMEQLAEAEAAFLASKDFTDEEKRIGRRAFAQERAGFEVVERPKKLTAADKFKQNTVTDKQGNIFSLKPDGTIDKLLETPSSKPSVQDRIKAVQAATALADDGEGGFNQQRFNQVMQSLGFPDVQIGGQATARPIDQSQIRPDALRGNVPPGIPAEDLEGVETIDMDRPREPGTAPDGPTADLDTALEEIRGGELVDGNIANPADIKGLAVAVDQIQRSHDTLERLNKELNDKGKRSLGMSEATRRRSIIDQIEDETGRLAQLEARKAQLQKQADMLQARKEARAVAAEARARQQDNRPADFVGPPPTAAPAPAAPATSFGGIGRGQKVAEAELARAQRVAAGGARQQQLQAGELRAIVGAKDEDAEMLRSLLGLLRERSEGLRGEQAAQLERGLINEQIDLIEKKLKGFGLPSFAEREGAKTKVTRSKKKTSLKNKGSKIERAGKKKTRKKRRRRN